MIIPKQIRFEPYGTPWTVQVRHDRRIAYSGMCYIDTKRIVVCAENRDGARSPARMWHTFWHELLHAALHDMAHPLQRNEIFVDMLAARLAFVTRTARLP